MENKQTAVEFLEDKIITLGSLSGSITYRQMKEYIDQAKLMEKEREDKLQAALNRMLSMDLEAGRVSIRQ